MKSSLINFPEIKKHVDFLTCWLQLSSIWKMSDNFCWYASQLTADLNRLF